MENEQFLKETLATHLGMGKAFIPIDKIINQIPLDKVGVRPAGLPYSFYELLYHVHFAQKDILDYCLNKDYKAPSWPNDYWPGAPSPENPNDWEMLKKDYIQLRKKLQEFILNTDVSLTDKVKGQERSDDEEHTVFREILLVLEHSAYHTGQLVLVVRLLDEYPA